MMKALALVTLITTCVAFSQLPPIPGRGGGGGGTNSLPPYIPKPLVLVDGLITNTTLESIEWVKWSQNAYSVHHSPSLMEPEWTELGLEVKSFTHSNPTGFYKVCREANTATFPIWNSGTTNLDWIAQTSCSWLTLEDDVGFDVLPDNGEGWLIVTLHNPPETWEVGVITIVAGSSGEALNQSMQVTVVINNPLGD